MDLFRVNQLYSRHKEIQPILGRLANHGSIQKSTKYPIVSLFSDDYGTQPWFKDSWSDDHTFFSFAGSRQASKNVKLTSHVIDNNSLYLFHCTTPDKLYKFLGEFVFWRERKAESNTGTPIPDDIFVFDLLPVQSPSPVGNFDDLLSRSQSFRRKNWASPPPGQKKPEQIAGPSSPLFKRDPATRAYILDRAAGVCERCHCDAPFLTIQGLPYLESHHVIPLSKGGPDTWYNVVGLCPNCHRRLHHGETAESDAQHLLNYLNQLRQQTSQNA